MKLCETAKFQRLRKKLKEEGERKALIKAVQVIFKQPEAGKKLKGEFRDLRSFAYTARGQGRRLIYRIVDGALVIFSFGPRQGIYG